MRREEEFLGMDGFSHIVGQDRPLEQLKRSMDNNSISHAYLFLGPAGIGKMLSALAFAYSIIRNSDRDAALYINEGVHPDLLVIERMENKTVISKEQISKNMESWLALKPYRASRRIVIIRDAHLMSLEAANALLKTLEEPPVYAVIILVADENNLLETIMSRCLLLRFFSLGDGELEKFLLEKGFNPEIAYHAAKLGQGSVSTALRFIEEDFQKIWDMAQEIISELSRGPVAGVYNCAEKMESEPVLICNMMETILRDIYVYQETHKKELLLIPDNIEIASKTENVKASQIMKAISKISSLKSYYRRNINSLLLNTNISYEVWESLNS